MPCNKRFTNRVTRLLLEIQIPHFYARPEQARAVRKTSGFRFPSTDRVTPVSKSLILTGITSCTALVRQCKYSVEISQQDLDFEVDDLESYDCNEVLERNITIHDYAEDGGPRVVFPSYTSHHDPYAILTFVFDKNYRVSDLPWSVIRHSVKWRSTDFTLYESVMATIIIILCCFRFEQ